MTPPTAARLYAVTPDGAVRLSAPSEGGDVHALLGSEQPLGIYEGFRTYDHGRFLRLERHFSRARRSMALESIQTPFDEASIRRALQEACDEWPGPDCRIRLDVLRAASVGLEPQSTCVFAVSALTPIDEALLEHGVTVGVARHLQRDQPEAKTSQWVFDRRNVADTPEHYEHLLVDDEDQILECTSSNFFGITNEGTLVTAPDGILTGITMEVTLDVAENMGLPIARRRIPLHAVPQLAEAFLTSASRAQIPITEVEGRPVGSGKPGPIARALRQRFFALAQEEAKHAWPWNAAEPRDA